MKSLSRFISETTLNNVKASSNGKGVTLKNVGVAFDCTTNLRVEVPERYEEEDISIYLEDTLDPKLPGGEKSGLLKLFGENSNNITEAYLDWGEMESVYGGRIDIDWDYSYDRRRNDDEMKVMVIENPYYFMKFSTFTVFDAKDKKDAFDKMCKVLEQVAISNNKNKDVPELILNKKFIGYE